ncbi:glycosyltransferase family 4 protein [Psychrobacter frigidicola]|uniref:Glycosyltransferase family 4 protein n=1 Tax=Psychrobacter frigidicola TaxID=45611 RepID=A0A5C7A4E3_9GAMM|nr:glycosyltransferase family 4 protein [Psychrobacter frigidicola]TXD98102.1 glycosyltransferase family 4 protein [Psychrobacter frigidicola]
MKFLICANYLPHVLNFRGKLLEAIAKLGYEVHVLAPDPKAHTEDYNTLVNSGYFIHSIPMQRTGTNPIADIKTLMVTYRLLRKIKPDYILSYTIKPIIYGTLAAWLAKVPKRFILFSGLGYTFQEIEDTNQRSVFQTLIYSLHQQALAKSSKVFFQNPDDLNLFKKLNLLKSTTPTVIVNGSGVDVADFNVLPFPHDDSGNIKTSFLLIARLLKDKGIVEYVEAAKIIKEQHPAAEFHLVGYIDENPAAISQSQLDEWVANDIVNYWGKLNDVRPAIAASSIYVLPSYREGTSRSVLEAMAMGRPVITTDAPGCRETVTEGHNGYLVPVKAVNELAAAMEKFIVNPELIAIMGQESRKLTEEIYDVHKVNEIMIKEMGLVNKMA